MRIKNILKIAAWVTGTVAGAAMSSAVIGDPLSGGKLGGSTAGVIASVATVILTARAVGQISESVVDEFYSYHQTRELEKAAHAAATQN